jgi:hypothetical protein
MADIASVKYEPKAATDIQEAARLAAHVFGVLVGGEEGYAKSYELSNSYEGGIVCRLDIMIIPKRI